MSKHIFIIIGTQDLQNTNNTAVTEQLHQYAQEQGLVATLAFCDHEKGLLNAVIASQKNYSGVIIDIGNITIDQAILAEHITAHPAPFVEVIMDHEYTNINEDRNAHVRSYLYPSPTNAHQHADQKDTAMQSASSACVGVIGGFGVNGYNLAIKALKI